MVFFGYQFLVSLFYLKLIWVVLRGNEYKTQCNYFKEEGYPSPATSSLYDAFSTNYSYKIESGVYSLDFCNYDASQNANNGGFSWKYECCTNEQSNDEDLCIYFYEGSINCDLSIPSFTTIILSTNDEYDYNCKTNTNVNNDCTLSYSYYTHTIYDGDDNNNNNECLLSSEAYSRTGLINGACYKSSIDNTTYHKQICHPSISSYFQFGTFNDPNCQTGNGYEIMRAGECSRDDYSFGFNDIECGASHLDLSKFNFTTTASIETTKKTQNIFIPSTTTTSSTELIEECSYVLWDDIFPIIIGNDDNDYCVTQNIYPNQQSFNFFCSDNELWINLWKNSIDCSGTATIRGLADQLFIDKNLSDYNCKGNAIYCNQINIYRNTFNDSDYKQCLIDIIDEPQEIYPIAAWNQCVDNIKYFCDDDTNMINFNLYQNDDKCIDKNDDMDGLIEVDECIYSPQCDVSSSTSPTISENEDCNYAMIGNIPWIISDDINKYCVSFYDEYISGYLTCDDDYNLKWTIYNTPNCSGYSSTISAEIAFGEINDYNCLGSNRYCDMIYVIQNEYYSDDINYPVPTENECIQYAQKSPHKRYPIVVNECINSNIFYCDNGLNVSNFIDDECENINHYGFGFVNDELNVKCVYTQDCPTSSPTIEIHNECPFGEFYSEKCIINPCDMPCIINENELIDDGENDEIICEVDHCGCIARWYENDNLLECQDIGYRNNINIFVIGIISVYFLFLF